VAVAAVVAAVRSAVLACPLAGAEWGWQSVGVWDAAYGWVLKWDSVYWLEFGLESASGCGWGCGWGCGSGWGRE
jgi:hypothetical protein